MRELHVRAVGRLPELLDTYEVETNVEVGWLARRVLPRLGSLTLESPGTLPTLETVRGGAAGVEADPRAVEAFLADTFGGDARAFTEAPDVGVVITNRSGNVEELGEWYRQRLIALGVPEGLITVRTAASNQSPTRVVATVATWSAAEYYASLLHAGREQVDRFTGERAGVGVEIVLGVDAYAGPRGSGGPGPRPPP